MEQRIRIPVRNGGLPDLVVVVEPWATEMYLGPGEECEVVLIGEHRLPAYSIELCPNGLIFTAEEGTDRYELWRNGKLWG